MKKLITVFVVFTSLGCLAFRQEFAVKPRTRYAVDYAYEASGYSNPLEHPLGPWRIFNSRSSGAPTQLVYLFDEGQTRPTRPHAQPLIPYDKGTWHHEFYTGDKTVRVVLEIPENGKQNEKVAIDGLRFEEVKNAPTVNVNPDFAFGLYNYAGLRSFNGPEGVLMRNPEKGIGVYGSYICYWQPVPVTPGGRYRVEYTGRGNWKRSARPSIVFTGPDGFRRKVETPRLSTTGDWGDGVQTKSFDFTVPDEANWLEFFAYAPIFNSVRITETR